MYNNAHNFERRKLPWMRLLCSYLQSSLPMSISYTCQCGLSVREVQALCLESSGCEVVENNFSTKFNSVSFLLCLILLTPHLQRNQKINLIPKKDPSITPHSWLFHEPGDAHTSTTRPFEAEYCCISGIRISSRERGNQSIIYISQARKSKPMSPDGV